MSGEPLCPDCQTPVAPTWDWCMACGFDPAGHKPPDWRPGLQHAGVASPGASAASALGGTTTGAAVGHAERPAPPAPTPVAPVAPVAPSGLVGGPRRPAGAVGFGRALSPAVTARDRSEPGGRPAAAAIPVGDVRPQAMADPDWLPEEPPRRLSWLGLAGIMVAIAVALGALVLVIVIVLHRPVGTTGADALAPRAPLSEPVAAPAG